MWPQKQQAPVKQQVVAVMTGNEGKVEDSTILVIAGVQAALIRGSCRASST